MLYNLLVEYFQTDIKSFDKSIFGDLHLCYFEAYEQVINVRSLDRLCFCTKSEYLCECAHNVQGGCRRLLHKECAVSVRAGKC